MPPMVELGPWAPDQPRIGKPVLTLAQNTIPRESGYDAMPTLVSAGRGALDGVCKGAFSGRSRQGTNFTVGGSTEKLWLALSQNLADVTGVDGPYAVGATNWWDFAIYANHLFACNYTEPLRHFQIGTSTVFAQTAADSSFAKHMAVVRDFLVLANIVGRNANAAAIGTAEDGVHWSALDGPTSWPVVGTAAARSVQSDWQPLAGDGGEITDIVGGSDYGLIFRERGVWRMDYEGGDTFWRFTSITDEVGCIIHKAAIRVGGLTYFPSEQGFYVTDGLQVYPIGNEVVDRFFREGLKVGSGHRVSRAHFPDWKSIVWAYQTDAAPGDVCDGAIVFNTVDKRWANGVVSLEWVVPTLPFVASLDDYTDSMDTGTLELVNLDSLGGEGTRKAGGFLSTSHSLGEFSGEPTVAFISTGDYEPVPGGVGTTRSVRPVFDENTDNSILVSVGSRMRAHDTIEFNEAAPVDATGKADVRASGRYQRALFTITGDFKGFHGFDHDTIARGPR